MTIFNKKYGEQLLIATSLLTALGLSSAFSNDEIPPPNTGFQNGRISAATVDSGVALIGDEVWMWGFRGSGQAGNGIRALSRSDDAIPNKVYVPVENNIGKLEPLKNIKYVTGGIYHLLALDKNGVIWGWGQNIFGEAGCYHITKKVGKTSTVSTNILRRNVGVTGYRTTTPAPMNANPAYGEDSNDTSRAYPAFPCRVLPKGVIAEEVAAGEYISVARDSQGNVWLWGQTNYLTKNTYQMTDGRDLVIGSNGLPIPTEQALGANRPPQIVRLPGNEKARLVGAAYEGIFVVTEDNKIYVWGDNENGGLGFTTPRGSTVQYVVNIPTRADKIEKYADKIAYIAGGNGHGSAILNDGSVIGWGDTTYLGMGKDYYHGGKKRISTNYFPDLSAPSSDNIINRPILTNVKQYFNRYRGSLAVTEDNSLYVWGWGGALLSNGLVAEEIGRSIYGIEPRKVTLNSGSNSVTAAAGGKEHNYYWDDQGRMFGLGYNAGNNVNLKSKAIPNWPGTNIPYEKFVETDRIKNANK